MYTVLLQSVSILKYEQSPLTDENLPDGRRQLNENTQTTRTKSSAANLGQPSTA